MDTEENMSTLTKAPRTRFVAHLPDLITPEDYATPADKKKIRIRITCTDKGIEILGDSPHVPLLVDLLTQAGAAEIEMMLCG
jgi:hypothetical protein